MRYGRKDKSTGISLDRDVYAEQFSESGDIKTNYVVRLHGEAIAEDEDIQKLANELLRISHRIYEIACFLHRKGQPKGLRNILSGDK